MSNIDREAVALCAIMSNYEHALISAGVAVRQLEERGYSTATISKLMDQTIKSIHRASIAKASRKARINAINHGLRDIQATLAIWRDCKDASDPYMVKLYAEWDDLLDEKQKIQSHDRDDGGQS